MLIQCPECEGKASDKAVTCPHCGFPLIKKRRKPEAKRLPNGFGTVKHLSGNRRKPYAAYPAVKAYSLTGSPVAMKAIGYFETYNAAYQALVKYNSEHHTQLEERSLTFKDIFEMWKSYALKGDEKSSKAASYITAFKNSSALWDKKFDSIKREDMQSVIDACSKSISTKQNLKKLYNQLYKYAIMEDLADKNYAQFVTVSGDDCERGEPFSMDAIKALWKNKSNPAAQITLMMVYSGLRITELTTVDIDLTNKIISGGLKTKASKERKAPICDATFSFWRNFDQDFFVPNSFRQHEFYDLMNQIGFAEENGKKHTPHDCRHTFSWLCDSVGMDEASKHLLMGHALKGDTEQTVYRHRTMEQLRTAINLLKSV